MNVLQNVVGVLDMDGFFIDGRFLCKELGLYKIGKTYAESWFFDIGVSWSSLKPNDQRTCKYVQTHIHRLPLGVPPGASAVKLHQLNSVVVNFYEQSKTDSNSVLAYKGGHLEKDLLNRLNIPQLNLEAYGCPKAESLFTELGWLESCGNHLPGRDVHRHCPKVEVEAFGQWLNKQL